MDEIKDPVDTFIRGLGDAISAVETQIQEEKHPKPEIKEEDITKRIIKEMLVENTGCHILDSGGACGRHWQRNRHIDFDKSPRAWYEIYCYDRDGKFELEIIPSINVYHYLVSCLSYTKICEELEKDFFKFADELDECWLVCMEEWFDHTKFPVSYQYTENTYNDEYSLLSQVLQYVYFVMDKREYVLLQIHNGCDVRGGYTMPRIFEINDDFHCGDHHVIFYCLNEKCKFHFWFDNNQIGSDFEKESKELYKVMEKEYKEEGDIDYLYCPRCYKRGKKVKLGVDFDG